MSSFQIEKVSAALAEAGKQSSRDFALFLTFSVSSLFLAFPENLSREVTVPALGLSLSNSHAAEILLVLATGTLYRYFISCLQESLLFAKAAALEGRTHRPWYLFQPSILNFQSFVGDCVSAKLAMLTNFIHALFMIIGFIYPVALSTKLILSYGFSVHWLIAIIFVFLFLFGSMLVLIEQPADRDTMRKVLSRLEEFPRSAQASGK